jgi:flagellar biosynthesis GTPase FlhF
MSYHFSMGAINKTTNKYEYPKIANKINKYKCPFCEKCVIFRNGKIKQPHFAHYKSDNPCSYYDRPNESQIHKDAKMLMKRLLDDKHIIFISRYCNYCQTNNRPFNYSDDYDILSDEYTENTKTHIEYKFKHNDSNKSADVALVENDKIKYIFEICYKNKTMENNRPEPWFEIKAQDLINKINSVTIIDEECISLECVRHYKCDYCECKEEYEKKKEKNRRESEYKEKEKHRKKIEREEREEKEKHRKKIERQIEDNIKEMEEKQKKIYYEYNKKTIELNKVCSICNINYCKCLTNNFIKDEYNIIKCSSCNKRKCKCARITDFFKK